MRKAILPILTIALSAGIFSCAKSSKGKISEEWKVASFTQQSSYDFSGGNSSSDVTTGDETTYTTTFNSSQNGVEQPEQVQSGTIQRNDFTINKNGTWNWVKESKNTTESYSVFSESSGTWSFLSKNGDFKKNERVMFNVLSQSERTIGQGGTQENNATYLAGDKVMIFTIDESSKRELGLSGVQESKYTYGGNTNTIMSTMSLTLKRK